MTEVLGKRLLSRVPFRDLGFSRLFSDYCENVPEAVSILGSHFLDRNAISDSMEKARLVNVEGRQVLVDVLLEQNERWNAPRKTLDNICLLLTEDTTCVVTGQQLGLFVSPLYTIYKSLTAIQLASSWSTDAKPVVPVFWLADEDHDLEEISHCFIPSPECGITEVRYPVRNRDNGKRKNSGNTIPTGRLVLDAGITQAIDSVAELLPNTADSTFLVEALRRCYRPGQSFVDAFASFVHILLPDSGLIVMSGDDGRLKRIGAPLFERALVESNKLNDVLEASSEDISKAYHAQLHLRNTNLFVIQDGNRLGLDRTDKGFSVSGTDVVFSLDQVLAKAREEPEFFSPNVVLRPLYQDSILPTAAYVGGPGEVAYFGQIRAAYRWANIHMPIIYPRASLSLVDGAASRLLEAHNLPFTELRKRPDEIFGSIVSRQMVSDPSILIRQAKDGIEVTLQQLAGPIRVVDPTLDRAVEAIRVTFEKRLDRLEKKILREEKRKHGITGDRVERTTSFLFPNGKPQERMLLPAYLVGRFGRDYFMRLLDDIEIDTSQHLVLRA